MATLDRRRQSTEDTHSDHNRYYAEQQPAVSNRGGRERQEPVDGYGEKYRSSGQKDEARVMETISKLYMAEQRKEQNVARLRKEQEMKISRELKDKPEINTSYKMAKPRVPLHRRSSTDRFERLAQIRREEEERKIRDLESECTFNPKRSTSRKRAQESMYATEGGQPSNTAAEQATPEKPDPLQTVENLLRWKESRDKNLMKLATSGKYDTVYSFKPEINQRSQQMAERKRGPKENQIYDRLIGLKEKRDKQIFDKLEEERKHMFNPRINALSKRLAARSEERRADPDKYLAIEKITETNTVEYFKTKEKHGKHHLKERASPNSKVKDSKSKSKGRKSASKDRKRSKEKEKPPLPKNPLYASVKSKFMDPTLSSQDKANSRPVSSRLHQSEKKPTVHEIDELDNYNSNRKKPNTSSKNTIQKSPNNDGSRGSASRSNSKSASRPPFKSSGAALSPRQRNKPLNQSNEHFNNSSRSQSSQKQRTQNNSQSPPNYSSKHSRQPTVVTVNAQTTPSASGNQNQVPTVGHHQNRPSEHDNSKGVIPHQNAQQLYHSGTGSPDSYGQGQKRPSLAEKRDDQKRMSSKPQLNSSSDEIEIMIKDDDERNHSNRPNESRRPEIPVSNVVPKQPQTNPGNHSSTAKNYHSGQSSHLPNSKTNKLVESLQQMNRDHKSILQGGNVNHGDHNQKLKSSNSGKNNRSDLADNQSPDIKNYPASNKWNHPEMSPDMEGKMFETLPNYSNSKNDSNKSHTELNSMNDVVKRKLKKLQIKEVFTNLYFD
jgi:hypothetical protein